MAAAVAATGVLVLVPARPAAPQTGGGQVRGMGITFPRVDINDTLQDLGRMRQAGINTVTVDVWENVANQSSPEIFPKYKNPNDSTEDDITETPDQLRAAIRQAKQAGMRVYFMPKIWCPSCSHTWRGHLQPSPRDKFYENYIAFITKYAQLGREAGADVFVIGSEMSSTQTDPQWRDVATRAKQTFGGTISYVANWDTVRDPPDPNFVVKFWDLVDEVGVSAYFPLVDDERPSVDEVKQGWRSASHRSTWKDNDWVAGLRKLAAQTGKRIVFGEVGYLSATYAGIEPYNPACCGQGYDQTGYTSTPDMAVQTNFYQALLETFQGESWWGGVVWWEWYTVKKTAPESSMDYTPRDKMTEKFLKAWYVDGWRGGQFSSTYSATTTTTSPGSATTTTTPSPGMQPAPNRPPPPNSAPIPMQPVPSSPQPTSPPNSPPTSAPPGGYPPTSNPPNGAPPNSAPGLSPTPYQPQQPSAPTEQPAAPPPAAIPNSAPLLVAPRAQTAARSTTTTLPPTTTTTVASGGGSGAWPTTTTTTAPPTPPVITGRPVVARSVGARAGEPSRMRYFWLGGFSVFGPMLLGLVCLLIGAARERANQVFAAAPLIDWHRLPRGPAESNPFEDAVPARVTVTRPPVRRAPVSRADEWRSWIANWPHQPMPRRRPRHRRPGGRR